MQSRKQGMWWGTAIEAPDPGALARYLTPGRWLAHRTRGTRYGHPRRAPGIHLHRVPAGDQLPSPRMAASRWGAASDDAPRLPGRRPRLRGRRGRCTRSNGGCAPTTGERPSASSTQPVTPSAFAETTASPARSSAFSELGNDHEFGLVWAFSSGWGAAEGGHSESDGGGVRVRRSIWASLSWAPARLILRPSVSPSQPSRSASSMRAARLSRISARRCLWAGSGQCMGIGCMRARGRRGAECPPAGAGCDLAVLEVAEELLPFGVGGRPVFLAGAQCPAAGEEGEVGRMASSG